MGDGTAQSPTEPPFEGDGLAGLEQRPIEEIRSMRAECQEVETGLSFLRRVVQGRLDIVAAELSRRRNGGDPADVSRLIAQLPAILADHLRAPGVGRLPSSLGTGKIDSELQARVDGLVEQFDDLAAVDDQQLVDGQRSLSEMEHELSEQRRAMFDRIDTLQAELTRRYRTGEASVESLLH